MRRRYLLFALVFIMAAAPIYAGTVYYVDATNGSDANDGLTPEKPWKTINKVNNSIFVPGDSILFKRSETWRETLTPPSHGASGNNITFGAYGTGDPPKIDGSTRNYCVDGNKDYITITDLHFVSPNQYGIAHTKWTGNGFELSTPGWIVQNCTFTHCGVFLFGPDTIVQDNVFVGPSVIIEEGGHGAIIIRGLVAVDCSVLRNTVSGFDSRGIWFLEGVTNPTANDNVVHDIAFTYGTSGEGYGINFDGYGLPITGTVTALRNTVYNCASNGIEMENCSDGSVISGNLVHDCDGSGILYMNYEALAGHYAEQRGNNVGGLVSYNVIYRCRYGVGLLDVSDVDIWNNVLYKGVGSYPKALSIGDAGSFVADIDFRNNAALSGWAYVISVSHRAGTWTSFFSQLDYCAFQSDVVEEIEAHWYTLAQLQAASKALNCFTTSPGFVDAAGHDFHLLSSSPCINAGANVGLTQDYEGNSIKGTPDIGAYESGSPNTTTPPWVTTIVPSAIQSTSATGEGIVTADGGATVTERGLCWGLTANPATSGSHTHDGSGTGSYISNLTGLSQNTTYHVRAYATNSSGTGYGSDIAFTTLQEMTLPSVTTSAVTSITSTSAAGGGSVTSDGGATVTERGLCWGLTANPAISASHTHDRSGTGSYVSSLTGMSPKTTYHVRAYATNSLGTGYGSDIAFTTLQEMTLPSVTTSAVTSITPTSAAGGGSVTSDGGATVTERGLCWGLTANPEISGSHTHDGSGTGSFVSSLTGLSQNTTYHVRAYAMNSAGTGYGIDIAFTTSQGMTLPSVTTSAVTSITPTSAAGGGSVTSDGGATVTERGLCWGLTANPEISGSHTEDGSGTGDYVSSLTELSPNTTYHVRAYATNSSGTGYGNDVAFTTSQEMTLPSVTTSEVTSITSTSAAGGGSVTSDGGATVTERGLCWGLTANPEISGSHTEDGSGTGDYVSSLTELSPNTTYHVRAYATNSSGTGYGNDVSFMTLALLKYSIPFSESFSRLILPVDWTTRNEGTGIVEKWAISETAFSGGSPNEAIYSWQDVDPGTSRLVTPPIDTTGYSVLNMSFKHVLETFNSGGITIKIQTSPDGSTWTDEAWSVLTASSNTGPETVQTMLTQNLNRTTTYVAFVITGNLHYFDVWYIDDVRISATAPRTLKAPVLLTPKNGAMRQPIVIKLSWRDKNVRPAETGHRIRIKPNGGTYTYYAVRQNIQSYKLSRLLKNKKYYWNVLALGNNDDIADSPWSNSGKDNVFTTKK